MKRQVTSSSISAEEKNKLKKSIDNTLLWAEENKTAEISKIQEKKQDLKELFKNLSIF